jgi:hypothetical protein
MVQNDKRAIQLNSLAKTKIKIKLSSEPRKASKRKVSQVLKKDIPLNDDIYKEETIGKVKDLCYVSSLNQKYSDILSKSIEIYMDAAVLLSLDVFYFFIVPYINTQVVVRIIFLSKIYEQIFSKKLLLLFCKY